MKKILPEVENLGPRAGEVATVRNDDLAGPVGNENNEEIVADQPVSSRL